MNLAGAFADSAHKRSRKIALYWGEREYSVRGTLGAILRVLPQIAAAFRS